MTNTVYFDPAVGGNGLTVTDDGNPTTGLDNDGHRERLVPAFSNVVQVAKFIVDTASGIGDDVIAAQQAVVDAQGYAQDAAQTLQDTQATVASVGSMLGINFGSFTVVDGEMIVSHLTTTTPSLVDGDLILTYEGL